EREEHALRRKCEDLRLTLESRTRELSQSQELYSKLKQRVLHSQAHEVPPSVSRSRTPIQPADVANPRQGQAQSQLPRPVLPVAARSGASSYFPASPTCAKARPASAALPEWNRPCADHLRAEVPATPSSNIPLRNPRSSAFLSTPRTGVGTTAPTPGSARFHQAGTASRINVATDTGAFSTATAGATSLRRSMSGMDLELARPALGLPPVTPSGPPRASPQSAPRQQTSQNFELPGPILRRP
ncbi:hypothetical protein C8A05DRAFT_14020, partial [Staphylotrichum tortipilum]